VVDALGNEKLNEFRVLKFETYFLLLITN